MATVRIMSWNTNLTNDGVFADRIGALIIAEDPDICCLQQTRQQKLGTYNSANRASQVPGGGVGAGRS